MAWLEKERNRVGAKEAGPDREGAAKRGQWLAYSHVIDWVNTHEYGGEPLAVGTGVVKAAPEEPVRGRVITVRATPTVPALQHKLGEESKPVEKCPKTGLPHDWQRVCRDCKKAKGSAQT